MQTPATLPPICTRSDEIATLTDCASPHYSVRRLQSTSRPTPGVHARRDSRCDRDHQYPDGLAASGHTSRARSVAPLLLHEQLAADWHRITKLSCGAPTFPAG